MKEMLKNKILSSLNENALNFQDLKKITNIMNKNRLKEYIKDLKDQGLVVERKNMLYKPENLGLYPAKIIKNCKKFCFAQKLSDEKEIFIPGKFSNGALTGDMVFLSPIPKSKNKSGKSEEGAVKLIYKKNEFKFTGIIVKNKGRYYIKPDSLTDSLILIDKNSQKFIKESDKVIAKIFKRASSHGSHVAEIITNCGNSKKAAVCAEAVVESSGANTKFTNEIIKIAEKASKNKISKKIKNSRVNLTKNIIFTIDSAESKDLDDAVSIEKSKDCYHVGVHIADVSHYVGFKSALDREAYERGTSIYYANRVVPMLPPSISNGICSLNPNVERLAFSALIDVDFTGKIINYKFKKTIIRSAVKGIYKEINAILAGSKNKNLLRKYKKVLPSIIIMKELYEILKAKRIERGSPQISSTESKIILDNHDFTVDVKKATQGVSECIIEEFMLLANQAAATLAKKANIPFVYRVHEFPSDEKVFALKELAEKLGLDGRKIKPKLEPKIMSNLLEQTRNTKLFSIMNINILRSMAKAKYSPHPIGHYGLVLKNYTHFTSPIRRYSDLTIHRILTEYVCKKESVKNLRKRYLKFVESASKQATETEKRAMLIERTAADCYKAEYMKSRVGENFQATITSITKNGLFVALENTIEGFVKIESLDGFYKYDGYIKLINQKTKKTYKIGQKIEVVCASSDVNSGKIDFEII